MVAEEDNEAHGIAWVIEHVVDVIPASCIGTGAVPTLWGYAEPVLPSWDGGMTCRISSVESTTSRIISSPYELVRWKGTFCGAVVNSRFDKSGARAMRDREVEV